jgi:hypothetical protein
MNYYESIDVAERRPQFDDTMRSVFEDAPDFIRMFTVWKPDAIDVLLKEVSRFKIS